MERSKAPPAPGEEQILQQTLQLAREVLQVPELEPQTTLVGPEGVVDSLTITRLAARVEQQFDVLLDDDLDLEVLRTVATIATFVCRTVEPSSPADSPSVDPSNLAELCEPEALQQICRRVSLGEGPAVLEQLLVEMALLSNVANKKLAPRCLLPIPVVSAIKKELGKAGLLVRQGHRPQLSEAGLQLVSQDLGYAGVDAALLGQLLRGPLEIPAELEAEHQQLEQALAGRPRVDVAVDQSLCTAETSLRRALLGLRRHALVGKQVLCLGDDDLVSVSVGLLMRRLFGGGRGSCSVTVLDVDERILDYIQSLARLHDLPLKCRRLDLRRPLDAKLRGRFHTVFSDPPYTLPGATLFLSRAVQALASGPGQPVFFSFGHKPPEFLLQLQQLVLQMGLVQREILPRFNRYQGAAIIGNVSQMMLLQTTAGSTPLVQGEFTGALYTGEIKRTTRIYRCMACGARTRVGAGEAVHTIEQLKQQGCPACKAGTFERLGRDPVSDS